MGDNQFLLKLELADDTYKQSNLHLQGTEYISIAIIIFILYYNALMLGLGLRSS